MFTNEDFISYFTELEMMEMNMRDLYTEILERVSDPKVRDVFEELAKAEGGHYSLMETLRKIAIKHSM